MPITFGDRLTNLRTKTKLTQRELGEKLKTSRSQIAQWENDNSASIPSKHIISIAKFFSVSTDYLLGLSDEPSPNVSLQAINKKTGLTLEALKSLVRFKENDHVYKNETMRTDKCTTLSNVLSSRAFLEIVTSLMLIEKSDTLSPLYDVVALNDPGNGYYDCRLTPESLFDLQTLRLIKTLKEIRDGIVNNELYENDDFFLDL